MKPMGVKAHTDLEGYRLAFDTTMAVFEQSQGFPVEERYALTDQVRRSSRSVCANVGEAWRKRRYQAAFIAKLSNTEAEAAETQIWIEFAGRGHYRNRDMGASLYRTYDQIIGKLVTNNPHPLSLAPVAAPS
jgi:four helix bundle protein